MKIVAKLKEAIKKTTASIEQEMIEQKRLNAQYEAIIDVFKEVANRKTSQPDDAVQQQCQEGIEMLKEIDDNEFNRIFSIHTSRKKGNYLYLSDIGFLHEIKGINAKRMIINFFLIRSGEVDIPRSDSDYENYINVCELENYVDNHKINGRKLIKYYQKMLELISNIDLTYRSSTDVWKNSISTIKSTCNIAIKREDTREKFEEMSHSVQKHKIRISPSKNAIQRRQLTDMKNIKFSSVGKSFDRDRFFKYVVIDTETTGLNADRNEIIELSAVKYVEYEPVEVFTTLIKPKRKISKEITSINGITNDMVKGSPCIEEVIEDFDQFIDGFNILGYNLIFDLKFLFCHGSKIIDQKGIKYIDVYDVAKKLYNESSYKLDELCKRKLDLYRNDAHRSLSDCFATDLLFKECLRGYEFKRRLDIRGKL